MSAIKDAADAIVAAVTDLITAADAVLVAFQSGTPADQQAAIDELTTATATAKTEKDKLVAALPPTS